MLGTDLSGVVFAALAARLGYRVLVIGQGDRPAAYKHEGYWFLRRPELLHGFATSPAVQRALGDLSLGMEMKNRPQPLEPSLQVAMPGMRLDVGGARRLWERDVERELPGGLSVLDAFDQRTAELTRRSNALLGGGTRPLPTTSSQPIASPRDASCTAAILPRFMMKPRAYASGRKSDDWSFTLRKNTCFNPSSPPGKR